jgi:hypothetical protein
MFADIAIFLGGFRPGQKITPITAYDRKYRFYVHQFVVSTAYMGDSAAPGPLLRSVNQFYANRIVLNVPGTGEQVALIHHKRRKPILPQVPSPSLTEIDAASVSAMRLSDRQPKSLLLGWYGNQMNMIRHQTYLQVLSLTAMVVRRPFL